MSLEILAFEETSLGILCLRRRDLLSRPGTSVTEVTLNHEFLMSSYLTESEKALTRIGLEMAQTQAATEQPLNVLVGGLGLGYTAAEALKSERVTTVEVIEFLPQVISWLHAGLIPLSDSLNADQRLKITHGDIYARVALPTSTTQSVANPNRFDLIAIDVDHSPQDVLGDESHAFYSCAGLEKAKSHLKPGGVLGVWSYAEDSPLLEKMRQVFKHVDVQQITVWNDLIDVEQTDWLFFGQ